MELKDTISLMQSNDYKDRFKAEYYQTKIRYNKLSEVVRKYESHTLEFEPNCSIVLLKTQKEAMSKYLICLRNRAQDEDINLEV